MKTISLILVVFILFGCNNAKKRELNLKEKEIALKEREIALREKELEQKNELAKTSDNQQDFKDAIVTDIDGNIYKTVKIGNQIWMAENLKTTRYNDGTPIPNVTDNNEWSNLTTGAYCYYDNDYSNNTIYGKLYNWYAVETGKLAPKGWHVPTDAEWTTLTTYLGGESLAGGKMKSMQFWKWPNTGANNFSGFTGLPAGTRHSDGTFNGVGYGAIIWSSTKSSMYGAWNRFLHYHDSMVRFSNDKEYGYSVRCIKD